MLGGVLVSRGLDAMRRRDFEGALRAFVQALEVPPPHVHELRLLAARAALGRGQAVLALDFSAGLHTRLEAIADLVWDLRAQAYRHLGRWQKALQAWQAALAAYADTPLGDAIAYSIGDAHFALQHWEEAEAAYTKALRRAPRSGRAALARFNLAEIARTTGRAVVAASRYRDLAYQVPADGLSELARERLRTLVASGRAPPAAFRTRLAWLDDLLTARVLGRAAEVIETLAADVSSGRQRRQLDERRAILAYRQERYGRALRLFSELVEQCQGRKCIDHQKWRARVHSARGDNTAAVRIYLDLANRYRRSRTGRSAMFFGAWLAFDGQRYARAVTLFEKYMRRYPRSRALDEVLWYLGWNLYRAGRPDAALERLRELRARFPRSSLVRRAHYWEGRILEATGNPEPARQAYAASAEQDPTGYYGALARGRLVRMTQRQSPARTAQISRGPILAAWQQPNTHRASRPDVHAPAMSTQLSPPAPLPAPPERATLDWQSATGKRALRLLRLGMHRAAAREIASMDAHTSNAADAAYTRSWLMYQLGEYHAAYRLAMRHFGEHLDVQPSTKTRPFLRLMYPDAHRELVQRIASQLGISPLLLLSIIRQESAFDPRARSWASAQGLMQLIPPTARRIARQLGMPDFHNELLQDPRTNVRFGGWYIAQLVRKFRGNVALAVGSYNAGPKAVSRWLRERPGVAMDVFIEEIPYKQTRHYVKKVLGNIAVYAGLYQDTALRLPPRVPSDYLDNINF